MFHFIIFFWSWWWQFHGIQFRNIDRFGNAVRSCLLWKWCDFNPWNEIVDSRKAKSCAPNKNPPPQKQKQHATRISGRTIELPTIHCVYSKPTNNIDWIAYYLLQYQMERSQMRRNWNLYRKCWKGKGRRRAAAAALGNLTILRPLGGALGPPANETRARSTPPSVVPRPSREKHVPFRAPFKFESIGKFCRQVFIFPHCSVLVIGN